MIELDSWTGFKKTCHRNTSRVYAPHCSLTIQGFHVWARYIGTCHPIGYCFWGSPSLNRVSFLSLLALCPRCDPQILSAKIQVRRYTRNKSSAKRLVNILPESTRTVNKGSFKCMHEIIIIIIFHWIGSHFLVLGLKKGISFRSSHL